MKLKSKTILIILILIFINNFVIADLNVEIINNDGFSGNLTNDLIFIGDAPYSFLWVSNSSQGTVSKIDVNNNIEVARYFVGSSPSRTAVDMYGDMIVGLRGGGIVKIAGSLENCVDRSGDGVIQTSNSSNFIGNSSNIFADECVLWRNIVPIGTRGVVFDLEGNVWAGEYGGSNRWIKIDSNTGETLQTINTGRTNYGSIIDSYGYIWSTSTQGGIISRLNPQTGEFKSYSISSGYSGYGIVFNEDFSKIYGGRGANIYAFSLNDTRDINNVDVIFCGSGTGGYAAGRDIYGNMWFSCYTGACSGNILKITSDGLCGGSVNTNIGSNHGVVGDGFGNVWSFSFSGSSISKVDPINMNVILTMTGFNGLYTYSDASGYLLRNILEKDYGIANFKINNSDINLGKITFNIENLVDGDLNIFLQDGTQINNGDILNFEFSEIFINVMIKLNSNGSSPILKNFDIKPVNILVIQDIRFNPVTPFSMDDVNILFEIENLYGGEVECIIRENSAVQTKSGDTLLFNFYLSKFRAGSYPVTIFCNNEFESIEKIEYLNVLSLPDLVAENLVVRSNPDVGDVIEIIGEVKYNGNTRNPVSISVPVEFVYNDLNTGLVERENRVISVNRNSSAFVSFNKLVDSGGWKIVEFVVDPLNVVGEENEYNNRLSKIVYGGLFDPSRASMRINVDSLVYPFERPLNSAGFLFVGQATYVFDGLITSYPVAGAQVDITIDSSNISDDSPFANLVAWTRSDGNFVIPYNNPNVLGDYNALIEVTDGTAYGFSLEDFRVGQNGLIDYNTPWGNWNPPFHGPPGFGGGWGGGSGGGGGWGYPEPVDCNKPELGASLSVSYPNVNFYISGIDASDPTLSIVDKSYNIRVVMNGETINLSKTGVFNGLVYSGVINESNLPQVVSVFVDSGNVIDECSEYDNFVQRELSGPNVKASSISASSLNNNKIIRGESTRFSLVMQNTGSTVLNNVPVEFLADNNLLYSYTISSINPGQSHTQIFESYLDNYGSVNFILRTSYIDSDMSDNVLNKLITIYLPDYYMRSVEDLVRNIIVSPENPFIGENLSVHVTMKSNDVVSRDLVVPFDLLEDGLIVSSGEVIFRGGADFAQVQINDYNAPLREGVYNLGIYVNRALRHFEEDSMNNYATVALMVGANNLIDANVLLLKVIDDKLNFVVEKSLNTKFSSSSDILPQIIDYINNSIDLKVDSLDKSEDIFRIRVDVNNEQYFSNYFLVKEHNCGDAIVVPTCENGFEPTPGFDEFNCPILICTPIVIESCWSEDVSPHPICSLSDLNRVREHLDWSYVLMNDINAYETRTWNNGLGWDPIGEYWTTSPSFKGSLDGNNFVISGLYINRPSEEYVGLFGNCECDLKNVKLVESEVVGNLHVGCLTGSKGVREINNSSVDCVVVGNRNVGGLAGHNNGVIRSSYSKGFVTGLSDSVGGLIGVNYYGVVYDSYSLADVNGSSYVGGLVGVNHDYGGRAFIYNSYSVGAVKSFGSVSSHGGLIGSGGGGYVIGSYWDINTSNWLTSSGGTGKTTSEMFSPSTFVDWDNNVWSIVQGEYPKLNWQVKEKSVSSDSELNAGPVKKV